MRAKSTQIEVESKQLLHGSYMKPQMDGIPLKLTGISEFSLLKKYSFPLKALLPPGWFGFIYRIIPGTLK